MNKKGFKDLIVLAVHCDQIESFSEFILEKGLPIDKEKKRKIKMNLQSLKLHSSSIIRTLVELGIPREVIIEMGGAVGDALSESINKISNENTL